MASINAQDVLTLLRRTVQEIFYRDHGAAISPEADALARIERVLVIADGKMGGTDLIQ